MPVVQHSKAVRVVGRAARAGIIGEPGPSLMFWVWVFWVWAEGRWRGAATALSMCSVYGARLGLAGHGNLDGLVHLPPLVVGQSLFELELLCALLYHQLVLLKNLPTLAFRIQLLVSGAVIKLFEAHTYTHVFAQTQYVQKCTHAIYVARITRVFAMEEQKDVEVEEHTL